MPPPRGDYTEILLRKKLIDAKQLADAEKAAKVGNISVGEALVKAGNCTADDVARACEEHRLDYANLAELSIPASVIALMPESIARDNAVLPLSHDGEVLKVIVSDPLDLDLQDKLRFVLNSNRIDIALAPKDAILGAINRYYGGSEAEKGLKEFSEGAIDFTETADAGAEGEMDESSAPIIRLVQMIITEAVTSALRTSTSSRLRTAYGSVTALTVCWSSVIAPPNGYWAQSSPASRFWPKSTSLSGAVPKTDASR